MGVKTSNLPYLFKDYLDLKLKDRKTYSQWESIASPFDIAMTYHSSDLCSFISNIFSGQAAEESPKVPQLVQEFRQRMRFVDGHDQQCNYFKFPFKVRKAKDRLFNSLERSMQVNCDVIVNFERGFFFFFFFFFFF
jgi:hypothetical protein